LLSVLTLFGKSLLPLFNDGGKYVSHYPHTAIKLIQTRASCTEYGKKRTPRVAKQQRAEAAAAEVRLHEMSGLLLHLRVDSGLQVGY
jgi:hypothetical protein